MNLSRKHLPILALGVSLALLSGCNKPAGDSAPASTDATPAPPPAAATPATVPSPPSSTSNSYDSGAPQGTSNEAPAIVPPPVDSNDSSQDATRNPAGDTRPDNPSSPPSGDGNGG